MLRLTCAAPGHRKASVNDYRVSAARFYDVFRDFDDVDFYLQRVTPTRRVLELGCGTGWVTVALAARCAYVHGVDHSAAMLAHAREKVDAAMTDPAQPLPAHRLQLTEGDITSVDLGESFDFVIAPFRVMQNLKTDAQLDGLFGTIERHLAPGGRAILNVFKPRVDRERLVAAWSSGSERVHEPRDTAVGRVRLVERLAGVQRQPLVLYPELRYELLGCDDEVQDVAELKIAMRVYYPDEFLGLFTSRGVSILERHGGYAGETYADGPELIVEFTLR